MKNSFFGHLEINLFPQMKSLVFTGICGYKSDENCPVGDKEQIITSKMMIVYELFTKTAVPKSLFLEMANILPQSIYKQISKMKQEGLIKKSPPLYPN